MRQGKLLLVAAACAAVFLIAPGDAAAQATTFPDNFEAAGGTAPDNANWVFSPAVGGVVWKVDGVELGEAPLGQVGPGPGTAAFAGAGSVNFNDDTDYASTLGGAVTGNADTPILTVVGTPITVAFQCNFADAEADVDEPTFDLRFMEIINPATGAATAGGSFNLLNTAPAPRTCGAEGTWHLHTIDVTAAVGALTSFRVRFRYNSVDGAFNAADGWFVDNLLVTNACVETIPPSVPTLLTPPDGGIVSSPPGVTLDWTDSTDTSTCGPAAVANYILEVDTTNPPVAPFTYSSTPAASTDTTPVLPVGTYFWRVRAVDGGGLQSANSVVFSFTVEPPFAPGLADTLHVNEPVNGAQAGDTGFVDPVIDEQPVFSAIYRDPNTTDFAIQLRYQISTDPTFAFVDFDSGVIILAPPLAKDTRCMDLGSGISLNRDTIYFWRIQFTDAGGLTGAFSLAQSFRIGDDFDFGVRKGSSNHSKRCFVASASFGSEATEVGRLAAFRQDTLEDSGAGRAFSRTYAGFGPAVASVVQGSETRRGATRAALAPFAAAASCPPGTCWVLLSLIVGLALAAYRRI